MEDFESDAQEEEVSSNEEADSEVNQPNDKAAGVALRTQRGAAAAWEGRQTAHEMLGWQHFGEREAKKRC